MELKKELIIFAFGVVVAVFFIGCVENPSSTLSPGETAILGDISFTVVRVEESNSSTEGAKLLWVYVKAKNVGELARYVPDSTFDIDILYKGEAAHIHARVVLEGENTTLMM